jgi:hypothetical protein
MNNLGKLDMDERKQKAFEFTADASKQMIVLATAVIGLSITFQKDLLGGAPAQNNLIRWAWGFYFASVFLGVVTLLALTGSLGNEPRTVTIQEGWFKRWFRETFTNKTAPDPIEKEGGIKLDKLNIYKRDIRIPAGLQLFAFLFGLAFTLAFGYANLGRADQSKKTITANSSVSSVPVRDLALIKIHTARSCALLPHIDSVSVNCIVDQTMSVHPTLRNAPVVDASRELGMIAQRLRRTHNVDTVAMERIKALHALNRIEAAILEDSLLQQ